MKYNTKRVITCLITFKIEKSTLFKNNKFKNKKITDLFQQKDKKKEPFIHYDLLSIYYKGHTQKHIINK